MRTHALLAAAALFVVPLMYAADTGVIGTWRGPENSVISIAPCGGALCARVLSTGNETAARNDTNNPVAALRTRPLCGLQVGEGFHGSDPNKAEGGHLYDPRSGKTYKGSMTSQGDVLLLRGYIGVSMFGRTARWERVTTPVAMCRLTVPYNGNPQPTISVPVPAVTGAVGGASDATPKPSVPPTPQAAPAPTTNTPAPVVDTPRPQ